MSSKKRILSQNDWLIAALNTLKNEGVHKVTVEYLARKLNVTKGSFYWHFQNRVELLQSMLDYWAEHLTTDVIQRSLNTSKTTKQRLFNIKEIVTSEKLGRYEAAIRSWANHDQSARKVVKRVDCQRYQYIKELFVEAGCTSANAALRARILIYYQVAEASIYLGDSQDTQQKLLKQRFKFLTADLP